MFLIGDRYYGCCHEDISCHSCNHETFKLEQEGVQMGGTCTAHMKDVFAVYRVG